MNQPPEPHEAAFPDDSGASMLRSEERLHTGTRIHPISVARIRKRIVTEQRTITVEVRHEEADLQILPAPPGVETRGAHTALPELTLYEEQIVITRRLVPVERVRLQITPITHDETVSVALRHEEITVDSTPPPEQSPATTANTERATP